MTLAWRIRSLVFAIVIALVAFGVVLALKVSPPDEQQGNMIRAFYYHFPNWIGTSVFLPLNLIASVTYLAARSRRPLLAMKADSLALASAEMGVVFCGLGLLTGSIWGRVEWGIWWTWDARLTTTLMLWLIYLSYLLVRRFSSASSSAVLCAVLAIFGFCDIPIVYMSTRWWRTQHPGPVFGGGEGAGLAPSMQGAVWWNVLAWVTWGALVVSVRYVVELRRQELEAAKGMRLINDPEHQGAINA